MMQRKEVLFAVIGGIVGAVLTMAAGLFSPLGAQNETIDLNVGEITCTGLKVVDEAGETRVEMFGTEDDGTVRVWNKGGPVAVMGVNEHGGNILVSGRDIEGDIGASAEMSVDEHGARVSVNNKDYTSGAEMRSYENGGRVNIDAKGRTVATMGSWLHGGQVGVYGKALLPGAEMSINEYGHGVVSTRDTNDNLLE